MPTARRSLNSLKSTLFKALFCLFFLGIYMPSFSQTICVGSSTQFFGLNPGANAWASNNPSVATVDASGVITGVSAGITIISFTDADGGIFTQVLEVSNTPTSLTLTSALGTDNQLVSGVNAFVPVTVSVNGDGMIYLSSGSLPNGISGSFSNGVYTISGTPLETGSFSYTLSASGGACGFDGNTLTGTLVSYLSGVCTASTSQLPVVGTPAALSAWVSSDLAVATVSSTGLVSGIAPGTCEITYTDDQAVEIVYTITVSDPVSLAAITGTMSVCVGNYSNLDNATPQGSWSSSNTAIATVDAYGRVYGVSDGSCTISYTAAPGGCSDVVSTAFTVTAAPDVPTLTLSSAPSTLQQNLVIDYVSHDTIYYLPLDPVTFEIGGSAIDAYAIVGSTWPAGVNGTFSGTTYTIAGNPYLLFDTLNPPTVGVNYEYTISVHAATSCSNHGGCDNCYANGTTVTLGVDPSLPSITGTIFGPVPCFAFFSGYSTVLCTNEFSSQILTSTGAATGASASGLPPGFNAIFSGGTVTISGAGLFEGVSDFVITPTSTTCHPLKSYGTIIINQAPVILLTSDVSSTNQTICQNEALATISYSNGGFGQQMNLSGALPAGVTGLFNGSSFVISGTPSQAGSFPYTVTTMNGSCIPVSMSGQIDVSVNVVDAITGSTTICEQDQTILENITPSGVWTSSAPSIASVSVTGSVLGESEGSAVITYTVTNGSCIASATTTVTVQDLPILSAISGPNEVCVNGVATLSIPSISTGTWASMNPNIATVSPTGIVNGVSNGTALITYTESNGLCENSVDFMINVLDFPTVSPIVGSSSTCSLNPITLTNATSGGTWSSSNPSIATVNANGLVSPQMEGTVVITYSVSNGADCATEVVHTVAIQDVAIAPIVGDMTICLGTSALLTDATSGGSWTSSDANAVSVSSNGTITANTAGMATITYTVNSGACVASASHTVAVEGINVAPITGESVVCVGTTTSLSSATLGGTWVCGNPSFASITPNGMLTGIAEGMVTITYTVVDGACTNASIHTMQVVSPAELTLFSAPGSDAQTVCTGSNLTSIYYLMSGASNVSLSSGAFPAGISGSTMGSLYVITGTPAYSGTFTYTLTTTGSVCSNEASISGTIIVDTVPATSFTYTVNGYLAQFTNTSTNSNSGYTWTFGNGIESYEENPLFTYPYTGTYGVTLTTSNGCGTSTSTQMVGVSALDEIKSTDFAVFPNPFTSEVHLQVTTNGLVQLQLFDLSGKQLLDKIFNETSITLDLQDLEQGSYILQVHQGGKTEVKSITKM